MLFQEQPFYAAEQETNIWALQIECILAVDSQDPPSVCAAAMALRCPWASALGLWVIHGNPLATHSLPSIRHIPYSDWQSNPFTHLDCL